jgi:hypothetical protein
VKRTKFLEIFQEIEINRETKIKVENKKWGEVNSKCLHQMPLTA